jgi:stage IV sporulation protein FB
MGYTEGIGGHSKSRAILARIFGDGENPLAWGLPVGRLLGLPVRVHLVFVIYLLGVLIFTLPGHRTGVVFVLPMLVALCLLVLLHELGHAIVCKRLGGTVDEIMLWPLGGLVEGHPPHSYKPVLITALGGLLANAALVPVFAGLVYGLTGSVEALVFNPLSIASQIGEIQLRDGSTPWWLITLWAFHVVNFVVLAVNALIPMYPLDAGRILQAALWKTSGYSKSMWLAVHIGLGSAVVLASLGVMVGDGKILLALAVFGGLVCIGERRKLEFLKYAEMIPGYSTDVPDDSPIESVKSASETDSEEIDGILAKISSDGIGALSRSERRMLKQATEMSRKPKDDGSFSDQ